MTSLVEELEALLAEGVDGAAARERSEFDRVAGPCFASIVLFGAAKMGRVAVEGLRKVGIEPLAFSDNNPALWGTSIDGVEVLSPGDAARRFGETAVFVITVWGRGSVDPMRAREQKLRELGCKRVTAFPRLYWKYPGVFLPRIPSLDAPHKVHAEADSVRRAFALLADEQSRREMVSHLRWRLFADFDALPDPPDSDVYFPADLVRVGEDEVFVDCGAFDGDTVLDFLGRSESRFRSVITFEPDPASVRKLRETVAALPEAVRSRIRIVEAAVGAENGTIQFADQGDLGSSMGAGNLTVPMVTLDDVLEGDEPTWIKLDIEAAEPDALHGARRTLRRAAPILAVCAYHLQEHLWALPLLIHSLNPEYRVFLRAHRQKDSGSFRQVEDLVCYAIPPGRLANGASTT